MTVPAISKRLVPMLALGMFVLSLVVYTATISPTLNFWDCGEYITTAHILGIPHQPGTPLYVLMGRVFDILLSLIMPTAMAVNFMSGFFSALAVSFVFLTIVKIARLADPDAGWLPVAGGLVGALFLMLSDTFWLNATEAEVYGLAGFMIAFLTWLALKWHENRVDPQGNRILLAVMYMLGLGVGFHLGTLLVYPGIFLMVLLARDKNLPWQDLLGMSFGLGLFLMSTMQMPPWLLTAGIVLLIALIIIRSAQGHHFILQGSLLFMLGLSVHLFMLIRAGLDPVINQSQPDNFTTLMSVLRREQYPPIDPMVRRADLWWQIGYYYNYLVNQFTFLDYGNPQITRFTTFLGPIFLALLGLIHGLWRARTWALMILVNYLFNADILNFYLNFSDHEVRERDYFYSAGFLFFAIFIGIGAAALMRYANGPLNEKFGLLKVGEKIKSIDVSRMAKITAVVLIVVAALPMLAPGNGKWFSHDRSTNFTAYEYAWNLLAGLDPEAILFTNGDNDTFPVWYLQEVEGFRRDVNVVNLSLVNLPWYTTQIMRADPPLELSYTPEQVHDLRWVRYVDPKTGEADLIMVKDYIVNDVLKTSFGKRAIYFAVTVPQENMKRYFGMLEMEGLAYRFTGRNTEDGMPGVNAERLLANAYGVYRYEATLDGDSQGRRDRFAELNNLPTAIQNGDTSALEGEHEWDITGLFEYLGNYRQDITYDHNANHLAGNYPAGLIRAGYHFLTMAESIPSSDDTTYFRYLAKAEAALKLAHSFDPLFIMVTDILPMVQIELGRWEEAIQQIDAIQGRIPPEDEQKTMIQLINAMVTVGASERALEWMEQRIAEDPDKQLPYQMIFKIHRSDQDLQGCEEILSRWETKFGQADPAMAQVVREMRAGLRTSAPGEGVDR